MPAGRYGDVDDLVTDLHAGAARRRSRDHSASLGGRPQSAIRTRGCELSTPSTRVDFFGRERLVERLIARLGLNGTRGRFIAVVGPSGSGKSSAVKAGLLPAIRRGALPLSGSWFTIEMTPAPHPFEQLEEALLGVAVDPPPSLLEQLAGEQGHAACARPVLPDDGSQLLLLIDQFEELFTQVDTATANRFIAKHRERRHRSAESSPCRRHASEPTSTTGHCSIRGLGELLRDGTELITPMSPAELERRSHAG